MNKKLLIVIAAILVLAVVGIALNRKKGKISVSIGKTEVVSLSGLLAEAKEQEIKNNFLEAKAIYQKLIADFSNSSEVMNWQKKAEELNLRLLFSPAITPKSALYEIKSGDSLTKIANKFKTTVDLIKKSNNLTDDKILPGRKIKVWTAPFSIIVDKSQNTLILKTDEEIMKTYIVSTGKNNSTPTGNFKITNKLINPTWFKAGAVVPAGSPENILGTRWLGLNLPGYGLHGTSEPQSLGKQVTQGCVRLSNSDIEELYILIPEGTEVTIVD